MNVVVKKLPKSLVELTITLEADHVVPYLTKAAQRISNTRPLEGFRPGHAPVEMVVRQHGAMAVLQEALEDIVPATYTAAVRQEKLQVIGQPRIEIGKLAPENDVVFTAQVALLPEVHMCDMSTLIVEHTHKHITDADVDKAIEELRSMQASEVPTEDGIDDASKVVMDMHMKLDGVVIEGGHAHDHVVYTSEAYYIPGFIDQVKGLKKSETKTFSLPFPDDHYQKNIAGKMVEFEVAVKEVFRIMKPVVDDAFAAKIGQKSLLDLRSVVRANLTDEQVRRDDEVVEIAMLEQAVQKSKFGDIPEMLIDAEVKKMIAELEDQVTRRGMDFASYLANIKKTREDLMLEFAPEALKRVKVSLFLRVYALAEGLEAPSQEVSDTLAHMMEGYKNDPRAQEYFDSGAAREYVEVMIRNQKAIEHARAKISVKHE